MSFQSDIQALQTVLNSEIPLTRALGVRVEAYDHKTLCLTAPLEENINHKSTAFGGSLYSLAVLSGWGLLYLLLKKHGLAGHIVIQHSEIDYIKPVCSDIYAYCQFDSDKQIERFLTMYQRRGVTRVKLNTSIEQDGEVAVKFCGTYVIHSA